MKRKFALIFSVLIIFTGLAGCRSADLLTKFNNAIENTANIKNASESSEFHIKIDNDKSILTQEMKNQLEIYSDIKGSIETSFDRDKNIIKMKGHVDIKSIGFDFELYENSNKTVILFPLFPKYMVIDKGSASQGFSGLYFNSREKEADSLKNGVTKDSIKKLGSSIIFTPEGDIKAVNYNIAVTREMIKGKSIAIIEYILSSRELHDFLASTAVNAKIEGINSNNKDEIISSFTDKIKKYAGTFEITNPALSAAWDKDYIIREEKETFDAKYGIDSRNSLVMNISSTTKRWNIGKNTDTKMIETNSSNSFSINETEQNMPAFYRNLLINLRRAAL